MLFAYINYLIQKAVYEKDESGYIVAEVPWYQGFFSQWETYEKARENLIDAIQGVIFIKMKQQDKEILADIEQFSSSQNQLQYA